MKYEIKETGNFYSINGIELKEEIEHEELSNYQIRDIEDFRDNLIDWISEATKDREIMKEDLKYLFTKVDKFMFSSIITNEYICFSDNPDRFNEIAEEFIQLSKQVD